MRRILFVLATCLGLLCISCGSEKEDDFVLKSKNGFPQSPINLSIVNSAYDDYNSDLDPGSYSFHSLVFSSNRNSQGENFDIILKSLDISYVFKEKTVRMSLSHGYNSDYMRIKNILGFANTNNNEFGPYIYRFNENENYDNGDFLFFYSQDSLGHFIIKYGKAETKTYENKPGYYLVVDGPYDLSILNSNEYNVGYLSISNNKMYYQSDKDGNYDIYELPIDTTVNLLDFLSKQENLSSLSKKIVSSTEDDKCPFVVGNYMVFTSKRSGGLGGFDLWHSKLVGDTWSEPENMGPTVNTAYDEYRPIIAKFPLIPNDLMIFSSNRTGGHGGFDLYYMGTTGTREP